MSKEIFIYLLIFFDLIIFVFLIYLYFKFKKILNFPWDELEISITRAQELVEKLRELKETMSKEEISHKEKSKPSQVIELHKKGLTPREIARTLGLSTGEVEIILKRMDHF